MRASTLEKINGRMAREISTLKRSVHKAERALAEEKKKVAEIIEIAHKYEAERDEERSVNVYRTSTIKELERELDLERTVWNRLDKIIASLLDKWVARKKTRIWNWFLVKRLNKPRVEAVTEAGYIPAKLIKIANAYWEHDQQRMQHDEEIVYNGTSDFTHYSRKPGLIRRLKIWMGRA